MNTPEPAAELQLKTPRTDAAAKDDAGSGLVIYEFARKLERELAKRDSLTPTEQIRALLAPYLAKVQSLADSRPDLVPAYGKVSSELNGRFGLSFSATVFIKDLEDSIGSYGHETPEAAISAVADSIADLPVPPTREQLIAQKEAELAALKGGES